MLFRFNAKSIIAVFCTLGSAGGSRFFFSLFLLSQRQQKPKKVEREAASLKSFKASGSLLNFKYVRRELKSQS